HLLENVSLCLSSSLNSSLNWRPDVRHSTFESLRLGHSSQSIASGFLCFWDFMNFKKDMEFVGITITLRFTPVGRANHYMSSLKAGRFISITIINEVIKGAPEINLQSRLYYSVIHGFTPVGRANHYLSSLKADSIVKVDRFEVVRCSSMYKITDHSFITIINEVIKGAPEINLQSRLYCSTISK
uniref:DUF223 domain-containing protein n=1 Tax=Brassica oleracea var. oleracea TaxID=109376 RepID=A0A0D2ZW92_BRAOL